MDVLWYIIKDIKEILCYTPLVIVGSLALLLITIIILCYKRKKVSVGTCSLYAVFFAYLFLGLNITLFSREPGSRDGIDLMLFHTWGASFQEHAFFMENILLFVPFGILVSLIWKKMECWYMIMGAAFCSSVSLELMQLLTKRGYCQVDDVMTNVLGAMCGYLFIIVKRFLTKK